MRNSRKPLAAALALALVAALGIGGTIAWLTDSSGPVTNTFTVGDVGIDLYEHALDETGKALSENETRTGEDGYKLIPGTNLPKDPTVVVEAGSEDCWVFVKVEESANLDKFIDYTVVGGEGGWTLLEETEGVEGDSAVYYRKVLAGDETRSFPVLEGNKVKVLPNVTEQMMEELEAAGKEAWPKLTFTAYACQLYETNGVEFAAAEAWVEVKSAA